MDIDLLRAVAVLAVLFFHFRVPGFEGGFIGVDVFFVISGFLISGQLQRHIATGEFSYAAFLGRRARRLVPAYAATLFLTATVGVFVLSPDAFRGLLQELKFSASYLSNFLFWEQSGYFDTDAISKPLLHTWSLAVEEQFYLVWPFLLLLFRGTRVVFSLSLVGLVSFIACEWVVRVDGSAAFFLFPFRIFEFVIGALVPYLRVPSGRRGRAVFGLLASIGLILPIFTLREGILFPGASVLPTCLGTAYFIAARPSFLNIRNLFSTVGSHIGKISYSAYLVHWPLCVFYVQVFGENFDFIGTIGLLAATFVLSEAMWHWVEKPFLELDGDVRRFLPAVPATFFVVWILTLLGPATYTYFHSERVAIDKLVTDVEPRKSMTARLIKGMHESNETLSDPFRVFVVGDSHAIDGALALKAGSGGSLHLRIVHSTCHPLADVVSQDALQEMYLNHENSDVTPEKCARYHKRLIDKLKNGNPDVIVFSEQWQKAVLPYLGHSLESIKKSTGATIVVLGKNQEFRGGPGQVLKGVDSVVSINKRAWVRRRQTSDLNDQIRTIASESGVIFVDKYRVVCPQEGMCDYFDSGALTYSDVHHWTESGLRLFGSRLLNEMAAAGIVGLHLEPDTAE